MKTSPCLECYGQHTHLPVITAYLCNSESIAQASSDLQNAGLAIGHLQRIILQSCPYKRSWSSARLIPYCTGNRGSESRHGLPWDPQEETRHDHHFLKQQNHHRHLHSQYSWSTHYMPNTTLGPLHGQSPHHHAVRKACCFPVLQMKKLQPREIKWRCLPQVTLPWAGEPRPASAWSHPGATILGLYTALPSVPIRPAVPSWSHDLPLTHNEAPNGASTQLNFFNFPLATNVPDENNWLGFTVIMGRQLGMNRVAIWKAFLFFCLCECTPIHTRCQQAPFSLCNFAKMIPLW